MNRITFGPRSILKRQAKIKKFINGNEKDKHYIIAFMMGCLRHWVCLLAHKVNNKTEYIFYDSNNTNHLNWNDK